MKEEKANKLIERINSIDNLTFAWESNELKKILKEIVEELK